MWSKLILGALFILSLLGAFVLAPQGRVSPKADIGELRSNDHRQDYRRLKLMTWNIGNGDLESETRAHAEDLPAVADVIQKNDADAVAIQELTGEDQLSLLLAHLENRYRGFVCRSGSADRVDAVLVKKSVEKTEGNDRNALFSNVAAGDRFAAAATFRLHSDFPEIVLVSLHADAFSASRRRTFIDGIVDWARGKSSGQLVFIAGDFNFEVSVRNKTDLFTDDAKHDSESYASLLKYFRDLGRDAGETSINERRIDYIFGPNQTVVLRRAEVLQGAAVGRMDHLPLLVEVGV
jgi:endonuclease/exonuclease/phosphatase family metal-dependent hydrolase